MKLRTKLILAFLIMAVIPLTAISLYSYNSTLNAFHQAVEAEANTLTEEMSGGMASVRSDLSHRMERLGAFPFQRLMMPTAGGSQDQAALFEQLRSEMGDAAPLLDSLEFTPAASGTPTEYRLRPGFPPPPPPPPPKDPGKLVIQMAPEKAPGAGEAKAVLTTGEGSNVVRFTLPEIGAQAPPASVSPTPPPTFGRGGGTSKTSARAGRGLTEKQAQEVARIQKEMSQAIREATSKAAKAMQVVRQQSKGGVGGEQRYTIRDGANAVGTLSAQVRGRELFRRVLMQPRRKPGDIPFAIDSEGNIHTPNTQDMPKLEALPLKAGIPAAPSGSSPRSDRNWVVVTRKDSQSGTTFGVARPVGPALEEIRRTAVHNLGYGLGLVVLALMGVLPLSNRMTHHLESLTRGAELLAQGKLDTRVPVRTHDEIGRLAETFNRMAHDLSLQREQLVEQEKLQNELEMCRRIQEELLPRQSLNTGIVEVKGVSIPAREVGGDFFNYFQLPGENLAIVIGDVSGKGLPAALLMANLQARLQALLPLETDLSVLAEQLDQDVSSSTPPEVYLAMFVGILDMRAQRLRYVNAGHHTQFALHREGQISRLESTGRPIGLMPGGGYGQQEVALKEGDCLILYTDGLVECENASGEEFGVRRLEQVLLAERESPLETVLARVEEEIGKHSGGIEAADDATMVVLRVGQGNPLNAMKLASVSE